VFFSKRKKRPAPNKEYFISALVISNMRGFGDKLDLILKQVTN
jgi:hypothetical protein